MKMQSNSEKALFQPVDKFIQNRSLEDWEFEENLDMENDLPLSIKRILAGNSTTPVSKEPEIFSNQFEIELSDLGEIGPLQDLDDSKPEQLTFDEIAYGRFEEYLEHVETQDWEELDQEILFGENAVT